MSSIKIRITVLSKTYYETNYLLTTTTRFHKVYDSLCGRHGLPLGRFLLVFNDHIIRDTSETPSSLGITDGDVLQMCLAEIKGGD